MFAAPGAILPPVDALNGHSFDFNFVFTHWCKIISYITTINNIKRNQSWSRHNLPENPSVLNLFAEYSKTGETLGMKLKLRKSFFHPVFLHKSYVVGMVAIYIIELKIDSKNGRSIIIIWSCLKTL